MFSYTANLLGGVTAAAWAQLPTLSAYSLSSSLQRRVLSYLLRRTLGRFLKGGGLDAAQIDAGIGSGKVEVTGLELNADAINALLPPGSVRLVSGTLGSIVIQLPFPNLWSGELSVSLSKLHINALLDAHSQPSPYASPLASPDAADSLRDSLATAAEELLHESEEGQELEQTLQATAQQQDESASYDLQHQPEERQPREPSSLIAGLVEGLLARLRVSVTDISVKLQHLPSGEAAKPSPKPAELDLRLASISVVTAPPDPLAASRQIVRTCQVDGVELWILAPQQASASRHDTTAKHAHSMSSSSSHASEEDEYMEMSQAIPNLRESNLAERSTYAASSSASLYESAHEAQGMDHSDSSSSADAQSSHEAHVEAEMIFRLGPEPLVIRIAASKEAQKPTEPSEEPAQDAFDASYWEPQAAFPASRRRLHTSLIIEAGTAAVFAHPRHLCALLSMAADAAMALSRHLSEAMSNDTSTQPERKKLSGKAAPSFDFTFSMPEVHAALAYEMPEELPLASRKLQDESLQAYWARPSRVHPYIGHVRLRVETVELAFATLRGDDPAKASFSIRDLALYEHLSPSLTNSTTRLAGLFPIILFDAGMRDQYAAPSPCAPRTLSSASQTSAPWSPAFEQVTIDTVDWRMSTEKSATGTEVTASQRNSLSAAGAHWRTSFGERAWKVKPKHRRGSSIASTDVSEGHTQAVLRASLTLGDPPSVKIELAPLHAFVDLSTADRMLPLLRSLGSSLRSGMDSSARSDMSQSFATLHASPHGAAAPPHTQEAQSPPSSFELDASCDLIRLELRVPAMVHGYKAKGGADLRGGILIVDVHKTSMALGASSKSEATPLQSVRFAGPHQEQASSAAGQKEVAQGTLNEVIVFFKPVGENRASAFAVVGKLSPGESTELPSTTAQPLKLRVLSQSRVVGAVARPHSHIAVHLPCLRADLSKALLDRLELMADDFSQHVAMIGHESEGDAETGADALKILGSRFFGTRPALSAMSASSDSTEIARVAAAASAVSFGVSEVSVSLQVPRTASIGPPRTLHAAASEISLVVDPTRGDTTLTDLTILSLVLEERHKDKAEVDTYFSHTLEPSLTRDVEPMLAVHLVAIADADTSYCESKIDVTLRDFTLAVSPSDIALVNDVSAFLRSPEGAFEHVEPNEVTRLSIRIKGGSVLASPPSSATRAALVIGDLSLRTKLTPYSPRTAFKFALADVDVMIADTMLPPSDEKRRSIRAASGHWAAHGFAKLVNLSLLRGGVTLSTLTRPEVDVKITAVRVEVTACADTLDVAGTLAKHLAPLDSVPTPAEMAASMTESMHRTTAREPSRDLLASLDEEVFRRTTLMTSVADLVEDDIPRNADFLGAAPASPGIISGALSDEGMLSDGSVETLSHPPAAPASAGIILQTDVVTVRLLDPAGIQPTSNYFTDPELAPQRAPAHSGLASSVRIRLADCEAAVRLHAGHDWASTRTAIELEARRVRRRLQKIKQLLDEGQTPDDSVEDAASSLFDSIHIPLPQGGDDVAAAAALQAMDDELGDQSDTASSASTWQPLPGAGTGPSAARVSRRKSKLHRSRKSMIDVELKGIEVEFDAYGRNSPLASRIAINARSLQILDNIKTSTWHTFLTELVPENRAFKRDGESRMLHLDVRNVRPHTGEAREEVRVRMKLAPLRLHVDQDALDFLKNFFAWQAPNAPPKAAPSSTSVPTGPFIQHAEVFPIKLKLDYKPKRVDYELLRQGKTIELMNFFHFDGAEMTLRHVTMRGITGWPRLFDTLNDIWTPDVKANQLADVLSGIAPVRTLVNVGAGVADLVLLPIEQYQRDGRLARGLQKGASSFAKTTALEAVRLGARLATGTQVVLEQAEHVLGGRVSAPMRGEAVEAAVNASGAAVGPARRTAAHGSDDEGTERSDEDDELADAISRYADQPEDLRDALAQAYTGLSRGFNSAARTILAVPMEMHERGGGEGGGRPVVRALPIAVLRGAVGATEAFSKTFQGLQRELEGGNQDGEDKYKAKEGSGSGEGSSSSKRNKQS